MMHTRSVKELMSADIMTVADDMTTDEVARYLIEHEISGAPVVDEQGHLVGVVSMTDIGRALAEGLEAGSSSEAEVGARVEDVSLEEAGRRYIEGRAEDRALTVRDVMTPAIHQVPVTASAAEVARRMVEQHVHRLVVTQGKEPVGIITSMDLLKAIAG
jgi:predicted transcriptional regulator